VLKNRVAGAASMLEMSLEAIKSNEREEDIAMRKQALDQLYLTMKWCAARQILIDVAASTYQSILAPVDLRSFLDDLGRQCRGIQFVFKDEVSPVIGSENWIAFDNHMAALACENALTNAESHGDKGIVKLTASHINGILFILTT
jgi:hypothetical protein